MKCTGYNWQSSEAAGVPCASAGEPFQLGSEIIVNKSLHTKTSTNQRSTWYLHFNIPKKYACNWRGWPSLLFVDVDAEPERITV